MTQAELFAEASGKDRAEIGMQRALSAEAAEWRAKAQVAIENLARSGARFTAEDIRKVVGEPTRQNSMGAILSTLARRDVITCVGYTEADRASSNGRILRVWKGTASLR